MPAKKIFVNSAWAKKVPAKSPQGTDLIYWDNAFVSIGSAVAKYGTTLGTMDVILLDRKSTVENGVVDYVYFASQEIDRLGSVKGRTATSKVSVSGDFSLTYDQNSAPAEVKMEGFLNVSIAPTGWMGSPPTITVLGGKNTVSHSYTDTGTAYKRTASISSTAAGSLTVNNSYVATAGGAFSDVVSPDGTFDIDIGQSIFEVSGIGKENQADFDVYSSRLETLSGYAAVSLENSASADLLYGGTQSFSVSLDANFAADRINKSYTSGTQAAGSLTVKNSSIGYASGYATVSFTGAVSGFDMIDGHTGNVSQKTTYSYTHVEKFGEDLWTEKKTMSRSSGTSAAGKATISELPSGPPACVYGYGTVTVTDSQVGYVEAGSSKGSSSETSSAVDTKAGKDAFVVKTTTESSSESGSSATLGTLTAANSEIASIAGFNKIVLDQTHVTGTIYASSAGVFASDHKLTIDFTEKDDGSISQYKQVTGDSSAATGTLTMTDGTVDGDVSGYAAVTASDTVFSGVVAGGKTSSSDTTANSIVVNAKTGMTDTQTAKNSSASSAVGKLTLTGGSVGGYVSGFATVAATGTVFHSDIVGGATENLSSEYNGTTNSAGVQSKHVDTQAYTASGTLTLTGGSVKGKNIDGYAAVTGQNTAFNLGVVSGSIKSGKFSSSETATMTFTDKKDETVTTSDDSKSNSAVGKLTLTGGNVYGKDLAGFQTVTLTGVAGQVQNIFGAGDIVGDPIAGKWTESENIKKTEVASTSLLTAKTRKFTETEGAAGAFTLTAGATPTDFAVTGELCGYGKVAAGYGAFGGITGGATEKNDDSLTYTRTDKKISTKASRTESSTAAGSVSLSGSTTTVSGYIDGYAAVTLDGARMTGGASTFVYAGAETRTYSLATEKDAYGNFTSSVYTVSHKSDPNATISVSNGANVEAVYGVKTATIRQGGTAGGLSCFATSSQTSETVSRKGAVYSDVRTYTWSDKAAATVTVSDSTVVGISGAGKVTATDSTVGYLGSLNEEVSQKTQLTGAVADLLNTVLYDDDLGDLWAAKINEDDSSKVVGNSTDTYSSTASVTLTRSDATGILGFGTVKLLDGSCVFGSVSCKTSRQVDKIIWDAGSYTMESTTTENVAGSLTAQKSSIDGYVAGFASVTLDGAAVNGDISGGKAVIVEKYEGMGADYSTAESSAVKTEQVTETAAGTLKAVNSFVNGRIEDFKSVTFSGDSEVRGGIYGISGDRETVTVAAKSALTLSGNAFLGEAGYEIDTCTIAGTLRIAVDNAANFGCAVNKFSGKGTIAIQENDFVKISEQLAPVLGGQFDIVNGGNQYAVKAIRSRAEELADNTQKKATAMKAGTDVHGWLCSKDGDGRFEDIEDWFSFARAKAGAAYEVLIELDESYRAGELHCSLWDGTNDISGDIIPELPGQYRIAADVLSQHASVQLRLFVAGDVSPISYSVAANLV